MNRRLIIAGLASLAAIATPVVASAKTAPAKESHHKVAKPTKSATTSSLAAPAKSMTVTKTTTVKK